VRIHWSRWLHQLEVLTRSTGLRLLTFYAPIVCFPLTSPDPLPADESPTNITRVYKCVMLCKGVCTLSSVLFPSILLSTARSTISSPASSNARDLHEASPHHYHLHWSSDANLRIYRLCNLFMHMTAKDVGEQVFCGIILVSIMSSRCVHSLSPSYTSRDGRWAHWKSIHLGPVIRGVHYRLHWFLPVPQGEYLISKPQERGSMVHKVLT